MKHKIRYLHGFSFDRLFGELALASTLPRPTSPFLGMASLRSAFTGALFATGVPFSPLVKHAVAADTVLLVRPLGSAVFDDGFGFTTSTALALPAHVTKNMCYCKT
jgi:hypothetical protein